MNRYSNSADKTSVNRVAGPGMNVQLLFMCEHKGHRPGAMFRGSVPWRCAACVAKKAAA